MSASNLTNPEITGIKKLWELNNKLNEENQIELLNYGEELYKKQESPFN